MSSSRLNVTTPEGLLRVHKRARHAAQTAFDAAGQREWPARLRLLRRMDRDEEINISVRLAAVDILISRVAVESVSIEPAISFGTG